MDKAQKHPTPWHPFEAAAPAPEASNFSRNWAKGAKRVSWRARIANFEASKWHAGFGKVVAHPSGQEMQVVPVAAGRGAGKLVTRRRPDTSGAASNVSVLQEGDPKKQDVGKKRRKPTSAFALASHPVLKTLTSLLAGRFH